MTSSDRAASVRLYHPNTMTPRDVFDIRADIATQIDEAVADQRRRDAEIAKTLSVQWAKEGDAAAGADNFGRATRLLCQANTADQIATAILKGE